MLFFVFALVFLVGITLSICQDIAKADEVPAFFLKIAKVPTLPRVGRSGFENFFYKAEKQIPRIGRNSQQVFIYKNLYNYYNFFQLTYLKTYSN